MRYTLQVVRSQPCSLSHQERRVMPLARLAIEGSSVRYPTNISDPFPHFKSYGGGHTTVPVPRRSAVDTCPSPPATQRSDIFFRIASPRRSNASLLVRNKTALLSKEADVWTVSLSLKMILRVAYRQVSGCIQRRTLHCARRRRRARCFPTKVR